MDSMYLQGSEQVASAGSAMRSAANEMQSAASSFGSYIDQMGRMLSAHEENMTVLLEHHRTELAKIMRPVAFVKSTPTGEGYAAFVAGQGISDNPYANSFVVQQPQANEWMQGYTSAKEDSTKPSLVVGGRGED